MRFGILTYYNERYKVLGDFASRLMFDYSQLHGFDFICSRDENAFKNRTPLWSKIPLIGQNLPNYDWLMWMDSDAAPLNASYDARDFIDEDYNLILAEEHHPDGSAINTGILWIKNCKASFDLLSDTWDQRQCIHHPWGEQQGMIEAIEKTPHHKEGIKKLDVKPINVKPESFTKDDFICHVAGGPSNPELKFQTLTKAYELYN